MDTLPLLANGSDAVPVTAGDCASVDVRRNLSASFDKANEEVIDAKGSEKAVVKGSSVPLISKDQQKKCNNTLRNARAFRRRSKKDRESTKKLIVEIESMLKKRHRSWEE